MTEMVDTTEGMLVSIASSCPTERSPTVRPSTPENSTSVTINILASELGQDVQITMSPRKTRSASTPATPTKRPDSPGVAKSPSKNKGLLIRNLTEDPPKALDEYRVPLDILQRFPPNLHGVGWKTKEWYVVPVGMQPGIYWDYW
jgi:hypothetical protein